MKINAQTQICMIIGDPVQHSLSPTMQNAAFEALGINDKYVYVASRISEDSIVQCLNAIKTLSIIGVSCTSPLKSLLIPHLDVLDPIAAKIGAVNTIINKNGTLTGYNTDWLGIVEPLKKLGSLKKKRIAVIGAGGAAKAATYGLSQEMADIKILNRTLSTAQHLADEFGATALPIESISEAYNCEIIINTISNNLDQYVGLNEAALFKTKPVLFDISYGKPSNLLRAAQRNDIQSINGYEMLLYQGMAQFQLFTGLPAPEEAMRNALRNHYSHSEVSND